MCLFTIFMAILICIVINGGYSGWVLSTDLISKSFHLHLTFDISIESVKFKMHRESGYRVICVKITPHSIWIHCKWSFSNWPLQVFVIFVSMWIFTVHLYHMKKIVSSCELILSVVLFLFGTGTGINSEGTSTWKCNGNTIATHRGNN